MRKISIRLSDFHFDQCRQLAAMKKCSIEALVVEAVKHRVRRTLSDKLKRRAELRAAGKGQEEIAKLEGVTKQAIASSLVRAGVAGQQKLIVTCIKCGLPFLAHRSTAKFCSRLACVSGRKRDDMRKFRTRRRAGITKDLRRRENRNGG